MSSRVSVTMVAWPTKSADAVELPCLLAMVVISRGPT